MINVHKPLKAEDVELAAELAAIKLGCDPSYYGAEGDDEVTRQLVKMGYDEEYLRSILELN